MLITNLIFLRVATFYIFFFYSFLYCFNLLKLIAMFLNHRIRNSTLIKLKQLQDGVLSQALEALMNIDPIAPVLHESHIKALDIR